MMGYLHTLPLAVCLGMAPAPLAAADEMQWSETALPVTHVRLETSRPYKAVTASIERLGRFDAGVRALLTKGDVQGLRAALKRIAGSDGLAIHYMALHGDLSILEGKRQDLIVYYIGNVLSAEAMTKENPAAGLYAPLRVVVYANGKGGTVMEYDKPSTMFAQFGSPTIDAMGKSLDERLRKVLTKAGS